MLERYGSRKLAFERERRTTAEDGHGVEFVDCCLRAGCSLLDVWDVEEPWRRQRSPLCPTLFDGNASPLQRVFFNEAYAVLRVPSRYVEVTLPRQYRQ